MKTITQIKERIALRRNKLNEAQAVIVEQLKRMGALKIILFGSSVSGNITNTSDLDFVVIMPSTKTGWEWVNEIYEKVDRKVSADIIAYTPEEFEEMKMNSTFLRRVLQTGKEI